jgi:trimeric autotransporter adhesin
MRTQGTRPNAPTPPAPSRIATWLAYAALIACFVLTLGCGAKSGGDSSLIPGKAVQDAGGGSVHDAKTDVVAPAANPADAKPGTADAAPLDAKPVVPEAGPKPTLTSIAVTPADTIVSIGGKATLKVTGTYSDASRLDVTSAAQLTSSDPKVATVAGAVVTAVSSGRATIVAAVNGLLAFSNITVGQATVVSISLNPSPLSVYTAYFSGSTITATALMSDGSHKDVGSEATWTSADPTTAAVSGSGNVQGLSPGSTKITATIGQVQASVAVQVYGPALEHLTLRATPQVARPGDFVTVTLVATFDMGQTETAIPSATLESSNPGVLKLSGNGTGIALSIGKTVITAKLGNQVVGTIEVAVTNATLQRIEVSPATLSIAYPDRGQLTATGVYSDQSRYDISNLATWSTSDYSILTPNPGGVLFPSALGKTTVTASYNSLTGSAEVSIAIGSPVSLNVGTDPITSPNYGEFALSAYLNYADGNMLDVTNSVTWSSDDATIASVLVTPNYPANFQAGHPGNTKIRAKLGSTTSADVNVTVFNVALLAIDLVDSHIDVPIGQPYDHMTAWGTFQDGTQADITHSVVWKTGNTGIATISNDPNTIGQVTGIAAGTTSLTATLGSVSATTTATVN